MTAPKTLDDAQSNKQLGRVRYDFSEMFLALVSRSTRSPDAEIKVEVNGHLCKPIFP